MTRACGARITPAAALALLSQPACGSPSTSAVACEPCDFEKRCRRLIGLLSISWRAIYTTFANLATSTRGEVMASSPSLAYSEIIVSRSVVIFPILHDFVDTFIHRDSKAFTCVQASCSDDLMSSHCPGIHQGHCEIFKSLLRCTVISHRCCSATVGRILLISKCSPFLTQR